MIDPLYVAGFFGISEAAISTFLRSRSDAKSADKGTLLALWGVIALCMIAAISAYLRIPAASFAGGKILYGVSLFIFVFGIALRWYSIYYLGRFFTVNVAIASGQTVIDSGPYKFIRHPSYTGVLLGFIGVGLLLANYVSLALTTVPIIAVFLHRVRIEEAALAAGLGDRYREYMKRTRRLIPFVY